MKFKEAVNEIRSNVSQLSGSSMPKNVKDLVADIKRSYSNLVKNDLTVNGRFRPGSMMNLMMIVVPPELEDYLLYPYTETKNRVEALKKICVKHGNNDLKGSDFVLVGDETDTWFLDSRDFL